MSSTKVQERALASPPSAEESLAKAVAARTPLSRSRHARAGLAIPALPADTRMLLLRQLYLAHFEAMRFDKALAIAEEAVELGELVDVCHQDAARAAFALGLVTEAVTHLRSAARLGPTARRGFHHWTIGSMLYVRGRYAEAALALERALRWSTSERPLYRAHLTLARLGAGEPVEDARTHLEDLSVVPSGQGYGRFVLGMLAFALGDILPAKRYLESFVKRTTEQRPVLATSLAAELVLARDALAKIV